MRKVILLFAGLVLVSSFVSAAGPDVVLFYGEGCPHCAGMRAFLDELSNHEEFELYEFEVYFNQTNRERFGNLSAAYGRGIEGVPAVFVNDSVYFGFSESVASEVAWEVSNCGDDCVSPFSLVEGSGGGVWERLTIPAVLGAAVVDAINPCAFAVLIILMTTVLASGNRKRALFAGLAFSLSIFISYLLMGVGLYSAIAAAGVSRTFYLVVGVLALFLGLFNLKDYFWYGKWFKVEVPDSWRPRMKGLLKSVTSVPGAFFVGFVVSLFLLPCTSGPYIVILGLLSEVATRSYAFSLLVLYNLVFVLPMVLITLGVYFGFTDAAKAESWRVGKLEVLHLIAGLILLVLGAVMVGAAWFGYL